jgi:hypothetical protein
MEGNLARLNCLTLGYAFITPERTKRPRLSAAEFEAVSHRFHEYSLTRPFQYVTFSIFYTEED